MGKRLNQATANKISREVMSMRGGNGNNNNNKAGNNEKGGKNKNNDHRSNRERRREEERRQKVFTKNPDNDRHNDNPSEMKESARKKKSERERDRKKRRQRAELERARELEQREIREKQLERERLQEAAREREQREIREREEARRQEREIQIARERGERESREKEERRQLAAREREKEEARCQEREREREEREREREREREEREREREREERARERERDEREREREERERERAREERDREMEREREASGERERERILQRERDIQDLDRERHRQEAALQNDVEDRKERSSPQRTPTKQIDTLELTVTDIQRDREYDDQEEQNKYGSKVIVRSKNLQKRIRTQLAQRLVDLLVDAKYITRPPSQMEADRDTDRDTDRTRQQKKRKSSSSSPSDSDMDLSSDDKDRMRLRRHKPDDEERPDPNQDNNANDQNMDLLPFDDEEDQSNTGNTTDSDPLVSSTTLSEAAISREVEKDIPPSDIEPVPWRISSYLSTSWQFTLADTDESFTGLFKGCFLQPPPTDTSAVLPISLKGCCVPRSAWLSETIDKINKSSEHHLTIEAVAPVAVKILDMLTCLDRVFIAPIEGKDDLVMLVYPKDGTALGYVMTLSSMKHSRGNRQHGKKDIILQLEGTVISLITEDVDKVSGRDHAYVLESKLKKRGRQKKPTSMTLSSGVRVSSVEGCLQFLNLICSFYYVTFVTAGSSSFARECLEEIGLRHKGYTIVSLYDIHQYSLGVDRVVPRAQKVLHNFVPMIFDLDDTPCIIADAGSSWPSDHDSLLLAPLNHSDTNSWSPLLQNWTRILQRLSRDQDKVTAPRSSR
eukprot:TRINITY_DN9319_c0_g1_i1.p1 TRINITY_DN9319_c0_g1~~TRINITY_DN9319_c0_g1_i1.p1  ORF type:complete len:838 (+),score=176.80 TRINITY_DN9319_c0_g1_i1:70-2514(+)